MLIKYFRFMIKEYLFLLFSLAFTIAYWYSAHDLPVDGILFPRVLIIVLIPLFVWNFALSVIKFRKTMKSEEPDAKKYDVSLGLTKQRVVVIVATIAYIFLMDKIGFVVCTVLYIGGLAFYLGVRNPVRLILFTAIYTALIYAIFAMWLQIRFPTGLLF